MTGTENNPFAAPTANVVQSMEILNQQPTLPGPTGIGGWLIIPMLGLFGSLLILIKQILGFVSLFRNGTWERISTSSSSLYHPLWGPLIVVELTFNIMVFILCIFTLITLFKKSPKFPILCITKFAIVPIFIIIDLIVAHQIPAMPKSTISANTTELIKNLVAAAIWVPYLMLSLRVKNTFRCIAT